MPLTKAQRAHLEERLKDERTRALELLNRSIDEQGESTPRERAGDPSEFPTHPADLGTDTFDTELEESNDARITNELEAIDAALNRFYQHPERFGISEATGKEIPFERLDLIPWARN
ncbi:MAG: TraR/DksA family transcriptional regulator [Gemmatimonadales bacterium]